eukprot:CAMPEP_0177645258 /NCGR_PEP_ID=MMETSP0447-20121125/9154_1 /TAXON_ID=0 /ORGANISM="Stygamoeba regulata, Strain BSH-02190019" /LENGTH=309 /DNA_ID=CAMNT_0019147731 /DNA_START=36 /DNA_END=965 /DNA_ORIENTATION=+
MEFGVGTANRFALLEKSSQKTQPPKKAAPATSKPAPVAATGPSKKPARKVDPPQPHQRQRDTRIPKEHEGERERRGKDKGERGPDKKRIFDKPSHSGTGRVQREKRSGGGRGNWGKPGDEVEATVPSAKTEEEVAATEEAAEPKEPETPTLTLEEFMKTQKSKKVDQPSVKVRSVEDKFEDCKVLKKEEENLDYFGVRATGAKKGGKKGGNKKKAAKVNEAAKVFRFESPKVDGGRGGARGGRGGRGSSRGGRGGESRGDRAERDSRPRNNDARGGRGGSSRGGSSRGGRGGDSRSFNFTENAFPTLGQ